MLQFDTVNIDPNYEPPRPQIVPRQRRGAFNKVFQSDGSTAEVITDLGLDDTFVARFVSSETQGVLTWDQTQSLMALWDVGAGFQIVTDLLKPLGQASATYDAKFLPDSQPQFTPVDPSGIYYYMDIIVRLKEV